MISKEFVPYELCIALREIGFDEKCIASRIEEYDWFIDFSYDPVTNSMIDKQTKELEEEREEGDEPIKDVVAAPLYSQAFRWFREKYGLYPFIVFNVDRGGLWFIQANSLIEHFSGSDNLYKTYEETEQACLEKLIEFVRNEKQK